MRYTIAVDFDGVLHKYESKWINAYTIPDGPVDDAIGWLHTMIQKYDIVIHSTRCSTWRGRRAVRAWLKKYAGHLWYEAPGYRGLGDIKLSKSKKPIALVYLDDRAWRFTGEFPTARQIGNARPWNKQAPPPSGDESEGGDTGSDK